MCATTRPGRSDTWSKREITATRVDPLVERVSDVAVASFFQPRQRRLGGLQRSLGGVRQRPRADQEHTGST
jgi:hypothetical protein